MFLLCPPCDLHNHMESTTKKKTTQTHMRSPPINLIGEAKLHGDGRSQWQWPRRRKKKRERERERGAEKVTEKRKKGKKKK